MDKEYYERNKVRILAREKERRRLETVEQRDERRRYQAAWHALNAVPLRHQAKLWYAKNREKVLATAAAKRRAAGVKERVSLPPLPADRPFRSWKKKKRAGTNRQWARARRRARDAGIPYDRAIERLPFPDTCPVLGIPMARGASEPLDGRPSIDRIVPEKGYTDGNVAIISFRANTLKSNATIAELRAIVAYMELHELIS